MEHLANAILDVKNEIGLLRDDFKEAIRHNDLRHENSRDEYYELREKVGTLRTELSIYVKLAAGIGSLGGALGGGLVTYLANHFGR